TLSTIEPILTLQVADYNYSEYGYEVGTFKNVTSYVMVSQNYGGIGQTPKVIRLNNNVLQVADYNYGEYGNTIGTFKNVTSYVIVGQDYGGIGQTPKVIRLNNNVLQVADYNYGEYGNTIGTFKNVTSYVIVSQNYGGIGQTPKVIRLIAICPADTEINNGKCVPKSCDYPAVKNECNIGFVGCGQNIINGSMNVLNSSLYNTCVKSSQDLNPTNMKKFSSEAEAYSLGYKDFTITTNPCVTKTYTKEEY
ncbi:hypothetical protein ACOTVS_12200, partial [Aliarcobacter butzleri]